MRKDNTSKKTVLSTLKKVIQHKKRYHDLYTNDIGYKEKLK